MDAARRAAVAAMLGARSVAIVGASPRPGSFGSRMILEAQRSSARMHLVNPRYDRIGDRQCAPSLRTLGEPVDLVLLGVPDAALVGELEAAAATGARSAVVFGAAHGLRAKVRDVAEAAGMALCGAGCMGFVNNTLGVRALGYLEPEPLPLGGICLVTHSGSAFSTLLRSGRGLGFSLAVSSGQELVTDTADYLDYALDDPATAVIGLLLETTRSAPRLRCVLRRAADRDVPVVMLAVGGSPPGAAMVAAHSGALAGADAGWSAFCAATGVVRVSDMAELTDTLELFAAGRRARRGRGVATVHDSGAERALAADLAHGLGVEFAELADATVEAIADLLDDGLVAANPLDIWGAGADTRALFGACLRVMTEDPAVGVTALAVDLVEEYDGDTAYPDAVIDVAAHTDEPLAVLTSVPSALDRVSAQRLRANGIPVLEGIRSGLAALGHLARWPLPLETAADVVQPARRNRWRARLARAWDPAMSFALLADYGVPVIDTRAAHSVDEVLAAAAATGYPVALKTTGAQHKSDVGGVILDLADPAALRSAYTTMARALGGAVTVSAMAGGDIEVSIGVVRDQNFGPLVVVAAGGTLIEVIYDRVVACPPVSAAGAVRLLDALRIRPLLDGWRGRPAGAVDALAELIVRFSELAVELGDALDAVEANPVKVSAHGVVAVDALVIPARS